MLTDKYSSQDHVDLINGPDCTNILPSTHFSLSFLDDWCRARLSSSIVACTYLNNISGQNREIRCFFAPAVPSTSVSSCPMCALIFSLVTRNVWDVFKLVQIFPFSHSTSLLFFWSAESRRLVFAFLSYFCFSPSYLSNSSCHVHVFLFCQNLTL